MNEEQLKKDKELLNNYEPLFMPVIFEELYYLGKTYHSSTDLIKELLEAQKRVSEVKAQQNFLMWWDKFYEKEEGKLTMKDAKCILFPKNDETK